MGPGNVLKDIIQSGRFHVVRLTRIFRQAEASDIILNAHRINRGEPVDVTARSRDFLFIRRPDANAIINAAISLICRKLPDYLGISMNEIQVIAPMRKGALGVERLNKILQEYLNPPSPDKAEKECPQCVFREGDKVMQIKNDYQLEWETKGLYGIAADRGSGVFNGDIGVIRQINSFAEELTVEFDEGRMVTYEFSGLDELELAYAITIHKSIRISIPGSGDSAAFRPADADDKKSSLYGGHQGQILRVRRGPSGNLSGHGGERDGAEALLQPGQTTGRNVRRALRSLG